MPSTSYGHWIEWVCPTAKNPSAETNGSAMRAVGGFPGSSETETMIALIECHCILGHRIPYLAYDIAMSSSRLIDGPPRFRLIGEAARCVITTGKSMASHCRSFCTLSISRVVRFAHIRKLPAPASSAIFGAVTISVAWIVSGFCIWLVSSAARAPS